MREINDDALHLRRLRVVDAQIRVRDAGEHVREGREELGLPAFEPVELVRDAAHGIGLGGLGGLGGFAGLALDSQVPQQ